MRKGAKALKRAEQGEALEPTEKVCARFGEQIIQAVAESEVLGLSYALAPFMARMPHDLCTIATIRNLFAHHPLTPPFTDKDMGAGAHLVTVPITS